MRRPEPVPSRPFRLRMTVPSEDIDAQGRASNLAYLRWMNDAAIAHSASVGFDHAGFVALGGMFVVRRHEIDYRLPVFAGDELELRTWPILMRAATAHRGHLILRVPDGELVASGMNVWGWVDPTSGRPLRMPPEVLAAFDPERYR